jgi:hypothetical protein
LVSGGGDKCIYMWDLEVWALLPRMVAPSKLHSTCF